jgi:branched-chain amino acid transport system substrate-binding protein
MRSPALAPGIVLPHDAAQIRAKIEGGIVLISKRPGSVKSAALASVALAVSSHAAFAADPIRIGIISEAQAVSGASIQPAAQLAADEINAQGGIDGRMIELVTYDDHSSAAEAVRALQRAVNEDKVNVVIASYVSEVVLALEPWAARLKTVMVTPGAASDQITENIAKDYDTNKYTFHGYLTSHELAELVCDAAKDLLVEGRKMSTAVIVSEDAAWTKPLDDGYAKCLPQAGLKVLDHVRFSPDTTDFTPIFNKVEGEKPDVMITGISHVGTQPTVQWKSQQVPVPMFGVSGQATNATFWQDTNGATEGVLFNSVSGPDVPVTPKTLPFVAAYQKKYGNVPAYSGYTTYDAVYYLVDAIHRAASTDSDKIVTALEATDYVGTIGRVQFLPKGDPHVHGLRIGEGTITGLMLQWQDGKEVNLWPKNLANSTLRFPAFIKLSSN